MFSRSFGKAGAILALTALIAPICALPASADEPYDIVIHAGSDTNALRGRRLTAYKLADYMDGTYVSIGDENLDGVAVRTPGPLRATLNPVLAKTTGVSDVSELPGWDASGKDPIGWMGGFRQADGSDQSSGDFGLGWNVSGPRQTGLSSPDKAYAGTVREFADNIVADDSAMDAVLSQPHSEQVVCDGSETCTIPLDAEQGSGIYLVIDTEDDAAWNESVEDGESTYVTGSSQPMIVPTKPDDRDIAPLVAGTELMDRTALGTLTRLGEATIKNVTDQEVLPDCEDCLPKQRDEREDAGKDAADNASDVGDVIPYVVRYRIPDLSAYRNALDNSRPWTYTYRVEDSTSAGLRIIGAPKATIGDADGQAVEIPLTASEQSVPIPSDEHVDVDGQSNEPADAWYHLSTEDDDSSALTIGIGRWLVKNYGDLAANDGKKTLYGHTVEITYSAQLTERVLDAGNTASNRNRLVYSNRPDDVTDGRTWTTPEVTVKQWTYDIDLGKRSNGSREGLASAAFTLTVDDAMNDADRKENGQRLGFVKISDGVYREAKPDESGTERVITGRNGNLRLRGLDIGAYLLREVEPPSGHRLPTEEEKITISAVFEDDTTDYVTPDVQTELAMSITQNNRIGFPKRAAFAFQTDEARLPAGLALTHTDGTQTARWSGQDESGAYYADDKTDWLPAELTLLNQQEGGMLASTGVLAFVPASIALVLLLAGGFLLVRSKRGACHRIR